jgi:hypothetical protein
MLPGSFFCEIGGQPGRAQARAHERGRYLRNGEGVKGSTGSRMRSAGRSPSTERVRIEAKRTLDALAVTYALGMGAGVFSPLHPADRGRLAPLALGRGAGGSGVPARGFVDSPSGALLSLRSPVDRPWTDFAAHRLPTGRRLPTSSTGPIYQFEIEPKHQTPAPSGCSGGPPGGLPVRTPQNPPPAPLGR